MSKRVLSLGYTALAVQLQEAAAELSASDTATWLRDALAEKYRGSGTWAYYCTHFGDGQSGKVIYCGDDSAFRAPYTIEADGTSSKCTINFDAAEEVIPRTTYDLKSKDATESDVSRETAGLKLVETTDFSADDLSLQESIASGVEREIKIIKPGAGSTAWYTESALRGSGPRVFKAGTQMFINHATRAEESERPEGDWHKLVGALTTDAEYRENGTKGPGLYAKAKFVSDVAPAIIEKAAFSGLSIRANGRQALEAGRPVSKDGLPVLSEFTGCESIDIVTRAGAGGMILTESARTPNPTNEGATEMNEADIKRLIEAETQPLRERALRGDALVIGHRVLAEIALAPLAKTRVIESCLSAIPITEGKVDEKKFSDLVIAEAKRESAYLASIAGVSMVRGMGAPADPFAVAEDPEKLREAEARRKTLRDAERADEVALYQELGMSEAAARRTAAKFSGEVIQ